MAAAKVTVKVVEGWAVYDGKTQRGGGETVEVDRATADAWLQAGWVEPVKTAAAKK